MNVTVDHYVGDKGKKYFANRFDDRLNFGRIYQSRYFKPYCNNDKVLLDFGCGDGTILRQLPAARKLGIEINQEAQNKIHEANKISSVPIFVYNSLECVDDGTVDIAMSNHCLEHVPRPLDCLKEINRILVPKGKTVLVLPFDDWRSAKNRRWSADDSNFHLYTWSPMNIGNLLTAAGFGIKEIRLCTFAWSPRLFWVHKFLGDVTFRIACHILGNIKNRREIFCLAYKD